MNPSSTASGKLVLQKSISTSASNKPQPINLEDELNLQGNAWLLSKPNLKAKYANELIQGKNTTRKTAFEGFSSTLDP